MTRKILFALACTLLFASISLYATNGAVISRITGQLPSYLIEKSWQQTRKNEGTAQKPWPWFESYPVARLEFPAQNKSLVVMQGTENDILAYAPGWHEGTDMPGKAGISLISGHRESHFGFLRNLQTGTSFTLQTLDGADVEYVVDDLVMTRNEEIHVPVSGGDSILLLSTSYPSANWDVGKDLNYVVVARKTGQGRPQVMSDLAADNEKQKTPM